jgi:hypothetical protein
LSASDDNFQTLLYGDDAIRASLSLEGRALFLLLCAEAAILRKDVDEQQYVACFRFLRDAVSFLKNCQLPPRVFEDHVLIKEGDGGFLFQSDKDKVNKDFWMFLTNIASWLGWLSSEIHKDYSYLADVDNPDSINRIFFVWRNSQPDFASRKYITDAFTFSVKEFPMHSGEVLRGCSIRVGFPKSAAWKGNPTPAASRMNSGRFYSRFCRQHGREDGRVKQTSAR